jgi:hypothetical protein
LKLLERNILILASAAIALVALSFAIRFLAFPLSASVTDWAALGEYFGGILSPILSFLLVLLIVNEAIESRKNFLDSKQLQLQSQDQINKQIELLTPRPDVVYYPYAVGTKVFAVVENIGNATAYNLRIDAKFDGKISDYLLTMFRRMGNPNYIPPKYKMSVYAGNIFIDKSTDLPPHFVTIRYSIAPSAPIGNEKIFAVDSDMLFSLHKEPDYGDVLKDIATELRRRK